MIRAKNILQVVTHELQIAMSRKVAKSNPNRVYLNRFRDLMIGIVLNLTCNVENEQVIK